MATPTRDPAIDAVVVDDDPDVADLLAILVERQGATVRTAYDAASGLELIRARVPNIVFHDICMPHMDGYDVARELRRDPRFGAVWLVAVTALGSGFVAASIAAGFDCHLTKPVDVQALAETLAVFRR